MVALKSRDADAFLARPDTAHPVVLIYGPDAGLVRERADALIRLSVDNPDDPFSFIRLDGDELSGDPQRLIEEANTIPLFGGRRAILVRAGSRNIVPAVDPLLSSSLKDCRVIIEAGELRKNAPLRTLCERGKNVAVIACYADDDRSLGRLLDDELRQAGLTIAPDARAALLPLLGGDRRASRSEIHKLFLYVSGRNRVTLDDVMAVISDASSPGLTRLIDFAFAGKSEDMDSEFTKVRAEGFPAGAILNTALRELYSLHRLRLTVEGGQAASAVIEGHRPPIHFSRRSIIEMALKTWNSARLVRGMQQIAEAVLETRRNAALADTIAQRCLLSLSTAARQRR